MINLDYYCMKHGQEISSVGETNLQKALGVLKEDGVYAMFLWLQDKDKEVIKKIVQLLNEEKIKPLFLAENQFSNDFTELCKNLQKVASDIDKLIMLKKLLERTLVYALYHAKGIEERGESGDVEEF